MEGKQIYFYGVMPAGTAPAMKAGIGGANVQSVTCGNVDALISWVSPGAIHLDVDDTLTHEQVLSRAMEAGTVIPAAFGYLIPSEADLCDLLIRFATDLEANLAYLTGRVEMGLKALWSKESFLADIETPELQELANKARQPGGADQSVVVAVGQLVEQLVTQRREQYTEEICGKLEPHAVAVKLNDPLAIRMAFNAAFLVEAEQQAAFRRQMEELVRPYRDRLEFSITGPWPPHNFVSMRL